MQVVYEGIRLTPEEIVATVQKQKAHVVGLSILSGSHIPLVMDVVSRLKAAGLDDLPLVVGGIIPPEDAQALEEAGVAAVYTPKDFELNRIMSDVVRIVDSVSNRDPAPSHRRRRVDVEDAAAQRDVERVASEQVGGIDE
jgi:(2R)-ethylmalonyl-CoA mutase